MAEMVTNEGNNKCSGINPIGVTGVAKAKCFQPMQFTAQIEQEFRAPYRKQEAKSARHISNE